MKLSRILSVATVVLVTATLFAKSVKLTYDPSPAASPTYPISYNVFIYTNSSLDTNFAFAVISTTNVLVTFTNLAVNTTYWANVNCQDTNGLTSDFSQSISFTFPGTPTSLRIVP